MKITIKRLLKIILKKDIFTYPQVYLANEYLGDSYGGWYAYIKDLTSSANVFSFGVGDNISFDLSLSNKYPCNIFAFDPTPKSIQFINRSRLPSNIKFFPWGISDFDGVAKFNYPENEDHVSFSMVKNNEKKLSVL